MTIKKAQDVFKAWGLALNRENGRFQIRLMRVAPAYADTLEEAFKVGFDFIIKRQAIEAAPSGWQSV